MTTVGTKTHRRRFLHTIVAAPVACSSSAAFAEGLASRLAKKDPSALKNSVFNIPPSAQVYPDWMKGSWQVTSVFRGYVFPSDKIPKSTLTRDVLIPGFQKCSIAAISDIGKDVVLWDLMILKDGLEDRRTTLASQIDGFLGYKAVADVAYDVKVNPNRVSIDFIEYKTVNAERIELFCNGRESERYEKDGSPIFVCSEYIRQVTFSAGSEVGVPRQVVGNYANFWTWKYSYESDKLTGNLLTAAYLDPQDALFFDEPAKPVVIYSHNMSAERKI
jgi:hypothetical protein